MRVPITWLDVLACFATTAAVAAYYILFVDQIVYGSMTIVFIQQGVFIVIVYVALELLSAALGEGGNMFLYWLSYIASWSVTLVSTFAAGVIFIGNLNNDPSAVHQLAVPYAKELLIFIVVFSWISAVLLQGHKHRKAWEHVTAARAIAPPAPIPPTIPAPVAPPVPGSAASVVIMFLLLALVVIAALATLGGGFRITRTGERLNLRDTDEDKLALVCDRFVGTVDGVRVYLSDPGCK